ncbi:MAG: hypothetical protein ABSH20_20595 [Tepidisphaeraceae bacterium]|jgi:hypothetical protein
MLRRWLVIFAAFTMLLLGSGALMALHEFQHDLEEHTCAGDQRPATPHDDSSCPIHAMLHAPVLATGIDLPPLGPAETAEMAVPAEQTVVSADFTPSRSCRGPPIL